MKNIRKISADNSNNISNSLITETKDWGNSLALRIPKEIRDNLHLINGSKVIINFNKKTKEIIIKKAPNKKADFSDIVDGLDLKSLTKKITKKNQHHDDFIKTKKVGKEIW
jgi:antitoxin component of MazEF toxin-antitoxin module